MIEKAKVQAWLLMALPQRSNVITESGARFFNCLSIEYVRLMQPDILERESLHNDFTPVTM